ncbi:acyl carrier protein [Virgibacillus kekensis]|uniref:Acyl carrier protein n=1 Tax=Virgibacillus kekensis TaxID=202261 RepID=A0ABV9DI23_9BACI
MQFEQFVDVISDITHLPAENITAESSFRNDLGIDSLNLVNLFIQLSEETGIGFEQLVRADDVETVGSVYKILEKR